MSGIVGLVELDGAPVDRALLERMTAFQRFRGPDGSAVWTDGSVGLGHTLLKTTDEAEHETQPCSLDSRVWITADARVDARPDLIERLRGKGRDVGPSVTDPELILHAYAVWSDDCLEHLLGDFSFAIWDGPRRWLFCAVDHWGVKPFYYAHLGSSLVFSNTLDCVRMHPKVRDEFNEVAIGDFLLFGYYQDRDVTAYADIPRLAPGHCLAVDAGGLQRRRYWSLPVVEVVDPPRPSDTLDRFRELLDQAVGDRLRTNRLGIHMSGGVDSPLVAATAHQLLAERYSRFELTAFTYVYDRLVPDDEAHYAGLVARGLGIPIRFVRADDFGVYADSMAPAWPPPEPVYDPNWAGEVSAAAAAASVVRALLTGWDGDAPLRADIRLHWLDRARRRQWRRLVSDIALYVLQEHGPPPIGLRTLLKSSRESLKPQPQLPPWIEPAFARRCDLSDRLRVHSRTPRHATARAAAYANYAIPVWTRLFDSHDPNWTGASLEAWHPLLDTRLVGFLLGLPAVPWCVGKEIFRRRILDAPISEAVKSRPKTPVRGDPVTAQLGRMERWERDCRPFAPELERFVVRSLVPTLAGCGSVQAVWLHLRPHGVDCWLQGRRRRECP